MRSPSCAQKGSNSVFLGFDAADAHYITSVTGLFLAIHSSSSPNIIAPPTCLSLQTQMTRILSSLLPPSPKAMSSQAIYDLTTSGKTVTAAMEDDPAQVVADASAKVFPDKPQTAKRSKKLRLHDEYTQELLDRAAQCGKFPYRPSDLFLKVRDCARSNFGQEILNGENNRCSQTFSILSNTVLSRASAPPASLGPPEWFPYLSSHCTFLESSSLCASLTCDQDTRYHSLLQGFD